VRELRERVDALAGGLAALGVARGETVALLMGNRPEFHPTVQEGVDAANAKLSRVEQIKRFTIVAGDWLPGGDELTPTMKLKRRPIAEKHAAAIDAMYS
jgi:long-subunit acyl-CoA synthetase (AMP-forming)